MVKGKIISPQKVLWASSVTSLSVAIISLFEYDFGVLNAGLTTRYRKESF